MERLPSDPCPRQRGHDGRFTRVSIYLVAFEAFVSPRARASRSPLDEHELVALLDCSPHAVHPHHRVTIVALVGSDPAATHRHRTPCGRRREDFDAVRSWGSKPPGSSAAFGISGFSTGIAGVRHLRASRFGSGRMMGLPRPQMLIAVWGVGQPLGGSAVSLSAYRRRASRLPANVVRGIQNGCVPDVAIIW